LYKEFDGIKLYRTSPHELNKNAIVERMIRTLKQYIIDIFMTYSLDQLNNEYLKYKEKVEPIHKIPLTFVDYILEFACEINNNKVHRTIQAIPEKVFDGLETNKQKIIHRYYPLYPPETIVIKRPESKGAFSNRIFNFDPEPYVVVGNSGRKLSLNKLIDYVEGRRMLISKDYEPYEIKAFKTGEEFMKYLRSELIKSSLIKLYGKDRYEAIINWFRPKINAYTDLMKKHL
jgi:hypothetical protein